MTLDTAQHKIDLSLLPCRKLHGVGPQMAERLARLNIHYVQDLLFHLPFRYQDRTQIYSLARLTPGDHVVVEGDIVTITTPKGGRTRLLCTIQDESGHLNLRFFYVNAQQRNTLCSGARIRCFGEIRLGPRGLEMIHPEYQIITPGQIIAVEENLTPIYPTTEGLSQLTWRKLTQQALQWLLKGGILQDVLPADILQKFNFPNLKDALHFVHRPPLHASLDLLAKGKHVTQKRLVFEELLAHRLSLLRLKKNFRKQSGFVLQNKNELTKQFLSLLPFKLTQSQKQVIQEIAEDLSLSHPMLRLVQGDVGSGKTVVAALAILQAIENGYQAVMLAPTEILAEQHFQTFQQWFAPLNVSVVMLSGQMKTSAKREALTAIANHQTQLILGTHAIFQKEVEFAKLALLVVDEQHRFGVEQRALLREKGVSQNIYPHQLIMTATPIPRTLAMSVYADLDHSIINELPPGRTPVTTIVISNERRNEVLVRIREACGQGRQVYWVCTLIEESEMLQCQAAEDTATMLKEALSPFKVGLIHGRMKPAEKEQIMSSFQSEELQLLVATTVIEVGVNVPNASLMIIENAERLGLAQLHQLRGRIGRGAVASHCVLMYQAPISHYAKQRLSILRETTDGFKVAQRDLELRGPGEVLGTRQTGEVSLRIADLLRDNDLLPAVQQAAAQLFQHHPDIVAVLIKRWLGKAEQYGHV